MYRLKPQHIPLLATAGVFVVLFAGTSIAYPAFFSWFQFQSLLGENATLGLAAIGMTFVILSGGIDLSVGAMLALASMLLAKLLVTGNMSIWLAVPLVLAMGTAFGGSMGAIIHFFRLPSFLVTLAGMFLARGVALAMTEEKRLVISGIAEVDRLASWTLSGLNLPAVVFLATMALAVLVANYSRFGRAVYALGGSESSAMLMGLPVARTRIGIFALSGFCAALGGVMHAIGTQAGDAAVATLMELDAIAAVVIGGTLLTGGVGHPAGTLLGVLILGVITTIPNYQGNLNSWWTKIAIGGLLLAFIVLQRLLQLSRRRDS